MTHKKHKMKPLVKLAVVALLFFSVAPLHAAVPLHAGEAIHTIGFTEANKRPPFIKGKDLPPIATGDGAMAFSLDLHFGTDDRPVSSIMPLIHYNAKKMAIIGLSNIAHAGFMKPDPHPIKSYDLSAPPTITVDGELMTSDADMVIPLSWMAMNTIPAVAAATIDDPVRIITIAFKWKAGATGNSYIGITQNKSGIAHEFRGASIIVRGPAVATVTARPASIDAGAGKSNFYVDCVLSRPISAWTTCILARPRDAETLASAIYPDIDGAPIGIPPGKTSGSREFDITLEKSDNGRAISIALDSAAADGKPLEHSSEPAQIMMKMPGLLISKESIETEEGKVEKFSVELATHPANGHVVVDVNVNVTGSRNSARVATVTPASLVFTADNWNKPQFVTVLGVDDNFVDGDTPYTIDLAVNAYKTTATRYHNITASVRGTTTDNEGAVLTAEPNKKLGAGEQRIAIIATLEGGGVLNSDTSIALRKAGGSAKENTDYEPFTLPERIIIPAGATSASVAFAITILKADAKTITIIGETADTNTRVASITLLIGEFTLDVDASGGRSNAHDGIMIARYFLGVRGKALTAGQSDTAPGIVADYIETCIGVLDVSENDVADSDDGTLIARYLLGLRGEALVKELDGIIKPDVAEKNIKGLLQRE